MRRKVSPIRAAMIRLRCDNQVAASILRAIVLRFLNDFRDGFRAAAAFGGTAERGIDLARALG